ncbi:MAG TPA: Stk1 family PASTA domain-containing Ser/Thr kinase [Candidatus Limnocylindria bacterium]|nr:Stk1 family PASTA domain-containing Ser/Thr kinase [Candidatus Limnocylindria bacterium]
MIGRLINGRYRLIAPLGEGGMATIWRALDEQLDREVAVKLLREQFGKDQGFAARFRQEARAAGSLSHPNIVPVYDYGTDEDGTQFIVMQLVEGEDLSTVLRERGHLETDDAVRIALGVASALEAAHRRGLVHRDVKPGNILITDDGDVKVTDFGIARAVSEASMTVTGTTLGSVHYFSPEQARGEEVTGASDVYALGIVLYEMLTGRRPFEGDSAAGVALKRLNEDAPPPSTFRPVPSGLSAIVMRALQREPEDRFPDAGSFAEALRLWQKDPAAAAAAMAGMPVVGGPDGVEAEPARAPLPPSGEPTVYVPPRVTLPADRAAGPRPPVRAPAPPARSQGQPWWTWLLVLLALLLLGLIGFLGVQILGNLAPSSGTPSPSAATFTLPDFQGETLAAARNRAEEELGLVVSKVDRVFSDEVEAGRVISTAPPAGTSMSRGDSIAFTVSKGKESVQVPNLVGQTRGEASSTLEGLGLSLGQVTHEASSQEEGTVVRTFPSAGTDVDPGSQVDVVLSSGPTPEPATPTPAPTASPTPTPPPPTPTPTPTP